MSTVLFGLAGCLLLSDEDLSARMDGDGDGDGVLDVEDCDPDDPTVYPGAEEICGDGLDNNCDGSAGSCRFTGEHTVSEADVRVIGSDEAGVFGWSFVAMEKSGPDDVDVLIAGSPGSSLSVDEKDERAGKVLLFAGPLEGTLSTEGGPYARIHGHEGRLYAGWAFAPGIDLDDDGFLDLVIGAPGSDEVAKAAGGVWTVPGPVAAGDYQLDDFSNPLSGHAS